MVNPIRTPGIVDKPRRLGHSTLPTVKKGIPTTDDPGVTHAVRKAGAVRSVARTMPWLIRARLNMRRTRDIGLLLAQHDISLHRPGVAGPNPDMLRRGIDRSLRVIGPRVDGCVPRSLALFSMLSRNGHPATFVSGVRREGSTLQGHAWVLLGDDPLEEPASLESLGRYQVQLRYENRSQREITAERSGPRS